MRTVLIGTPSYDGKLDVWYTNSLVQTVKMSIEKKIFVHAIYTSYDSLVQRARNSLVRLALQGGYDDLFFIDADAEREPEWFFDFLDRPDPVIGGAFIKKSEKKGYTVKLTNKDLIYSSDKKLIEVVGAGATGNQVALHPNIYNLQLPPAGQTEIPALKTNVFFDDFLVNESDLPGTGTFEERPTQYVCDIWELMIILFRN